MHANIFFVIVFGSIIVLVSIIAGTILALMKMRHGGVSRKSRQRFDEETRMVQEIYHGLTPMEKRVEALETILMGKEKDT